MSTSTRNSAIDALRGIAMVLMVLDHARDFYFGFTPAPTNLEETTVALFFTRWITHACAPVFVFLAGTSAYLYGAKRGRDAAVRFLWTRGLWLVVLELTILKLVWVPEPFFRMFLLQVIWAIGVSMIALSVFVRLPLSGVAVVGLGIVAGHDALAPIEASSFGAWSVLWNLLHEPTMLDVSFGRQVMVSYPVLPWIGVICLGYAFGRVFEMPGAVRSRLTGRVGIGLIAVFLVLRTFNLYGDPVPWDVQGNAAFTLLSFLNCEKYPPSLLYLCMTMGPALLVLAWLDRGGGARWREPLVTFGSVPLFFYVAHLYLLRFTAIPISLFRFGAEAATPPPGPAGAALWPLWTAFVAWAVALLVLYPACRWFAGVKRRRDDWWLSYL